MVYLPVFLGLPPRKARLSQCAFYFVPVCAGVTTFLCVLGPSSRSAKKAIKRLFGWVEAHPYLLRALQIFEVQVKIWRVKGNVRFACGKSHKKKRTQKEIGTYRTNINRDLMF